MRPTLSTVLVLVAIVAHNSLGAAADAVTDPAGRAVNVAVAPSQVDAIKPIAVDTNPTIAAEDNVANPATVEAVAIVNSTKDKEADTVTPDSNNENQETNHKPFQLVGSPSTQDNNKDKIMDPKDTLSAQATAEPGGACLDAFANFGKQLQVKCTDGCFKSFASFILTPTNPNVLGTLGCYGCISFLIHGAQALGTDCRGVLQLTNVEGLDKLQQQMQEGDEAQPGFKVDTKDVKDKDLRTINDENNILEEQLLKDLLSPEVLGNLASDIWSSLVMVPTKNNRDVEKIDNEEGENDNINSSSDKK